METQCIFPGIFNIQDNLLAGKPSPVGKSILQLVPVIICIWWSFYWHNSGDLRFAYPLKAFPHLFFLMEELKLIGDMLPPASSAYPEMRTLGLYPWSRILPEPDHPSFNVFLPLPAYLYIYNIARHQHGNKYHHIVNPAQGVPFGTDIGDSDILYYR